MDPRQAIGSIHLQEVDEGFYAQMGALIGITRLASGAYRFEFDGGVSHTVHKIKPDKTPNPYWVDHDARLSALTKQRNEMFLRALQQQQRGGQQTENEPLVKRPHAEVQVTPVDDVKLND